MAGVKWPLPFSGGACIGMHWTFCSVSAKAAFNLNSMSSPSHWFSKPCPHPPNQPTPWWPWHRDVASQANIFPALGMICLRWNYINLEDENKKFWKRNMHFRQSSKRRSSASLFQCICSAEVSMERFSVDTACNMSWPAGRQLQPTNLVHWHMYQ